MVIPNHHLVTRNQNPTQTQETLCIYIYICYVNWSKYSTASTSLQLQLSHHLPTTFPLQGHSQIIIIPSSLPHHSLVTPRSFAGHSQIIPTLLPPHSQVTPRFWAITGSFLVHSWFTPRSFPCQSKFVPRSFPTYSQIFPAQFKDVCTCLYNFVEYSRDSDFIVDLVSWTHQHIKILKLGGPKKAASFSKLWKLTSPEKLEVNKILNQLEAAPF